MNKAVFIDKDGTLLEDVPYNVDPERIEFTDGAFEALSILKSLGYLLIVVSNQSGVARGYFQEKDLKVLRARLQEMASAGGIEFDDFFFCPHHPDGKIAEYAVECQCRKPQPGMLLTAATEYNIDLSRSWMIGDILNDIEAGSRAGCKTILINNGNETEWQFSENRLPTAIVPNLRRAAERIIHERELV
jgi:D-glycero-D-manno-heptose 1,7-bisphosphate phosphatase